MEKFRSRITSLKNYLVDPASSKVTGLKDRLFHFWPLVVASLLSLWLSLLTVSRGHNYDFSSYLVVSDAVSRGENPWSTNRYNYGPDWAYILTFLKTITSSEQGFRVSIVVLLWLALVSIAIIFWFKVSRISAFFVLLSPVSVIIIGYHNQFDVTAIVLALVGVTFFQKWENTHSRRAFIVAVVFFGLSLTLKHIVILLPIWLAVRKMRWNYRVYLLIVPLLIFVIGFLPFLNSMDDIWRNVVTYQSSKNAALLGYFVDQTTMPGLLPLVITSAGLIIGALVSRMWNPVVSMGAYLVTLVTFTPAMANQYLLIAGIGTSIFLISRAGINYGFIVFTLLASLFLVVDINGLHVVPHLGVVFMNNPFSEYGVLLLTLFIGWLQMLGQGIFVNQKNHA